MRRVDLRSQWKVATVAVGVWRTDVSIGAQSGRVWTAFEETQLQ